MTTFKMTVNDSAVDKVLELVRNIKDDMIRFKEIDPAEVETISFDPMDDFDLEGAKTYKEYVLNGIREGLQEFANGEPGIDAREALKNLKKEHGDT